MSEPMDELLRQLKAWRDHPQSGHWFNGGESTDWEALDAIIAGKRVELDPVSEHWLVDGKLTGWTP